ncbi:restriction endonuclease subunit S [Vibrio splendidus]
MALKTKNIKIKELGVVITGGTPPTKQRQYYGDSVPLIKPTDMVLGQRYIGKTDESLSELGVDKFKKKLVPANTPCIVTIGTIGKSCLTKEVSLVNQAVNCVVVDSEQYDSMYVYYLLKSTIPVVKSLNSGTASGRENVSKSVFENIEVKVVIDKGKQCKIGKSLSYYDSLIENNIRRILILEEMAVSLYKEWFVKRQIPPQIFEQLSHDKFPDSWKTKSLGDVLETIIDYRGKTPKKLGGDWVDKGIKALSALNVKNGELIRLDSCKKVDKTIYDKWMKIKLTRGDMLLTSEAPLGEVAILNKDSEFCLSQRLYALRADESLISKEYLFLSFFSGHLINELTSRSTGSTVAGIRQALLKEIPIVIPPEKVMREFTKLVSPILEQKSMLWHKNKNLEKQRDMLVPKLLSGDVDL